MSSDRLRRAVLVILCAFVCVQVSGQLQREANKTLRLPPTPAVFGYTTERAFGSLTFTDPVAILSPPGETNRLFVVEQRGRVSVITNLANPTRTVFMDISSRVVGGVPSDEEGLLGMAFNPGYATNRFFYLYYTVNTTTAAGPGRHERLSCFEISPTNPNLGLPNSEVPLIVQRDDYSNHNGGCLQFGPDGYLYVSLGDEGDQNDAGNNSQRIDKDFFSGILRLDVDKRPGSLTPNPHAATTPNYAIPPDNPFVGATNFNGAPVDPAKVRGEFWAVGLRNPWRFSFDRATGILYCGDVGGDLREEIDIIVKGGNYGWAYREGTSNGPKNSQAPAGFVSIPPIQEYAHGSRTNQGNSVTGGVVYRGQRISQLTGAYVFADYVSGHIWMLRYDGARSSPFQWLATDGGIAGFGIDPRNGDILMANQNDDTIKRLVYNTNIVSGTPLPPTLADTGAFTNLATLTPHAGIVPYEINVPFWSDGARKTRWFSLPNTNLTIRFDRESNWSFPTGSVWIKHFDLELTNGVPASAKRLETRFIVRNSNGVYGATYRWGNSLTNATLVPDAGMDEPFIVSDRGTIRTQIWHYPSRSECLACHTPGGGWGLGFNTAQMNRDLDYGGTVENQIHAFSRAGYFATNVTGLYNLRALAHPTNGVYSQESRVRSYLAANCSQCHQPGGTAVGQFDARITTPMASAGIIDGALSNNGGDPNRRVAKPGSPANSMLLTRISSLGADRMPPLDSSVLDIEAIDLVRSWITDELAARQDFAGWQVNNFGSSSAPDAGPDADPDKDGARNYLEYLTRTNPTTDSDAWKISIQQTGETVQIIFPQVANRGFEVQSTSDLFDVNSWRPLDHPSNRPFFSITNRTAIVEDALGATQSKFYRVRVYEP